MKRSLFLSLLLLLCHLGANSQTVLMDKDDAFPVGYASVFNEKGEFLGQTTVDGLLPDLNGAKSIRVTHIAYKPLKADVKDIGKELQIEAAEINLGEAVVAVEKPYCIRLTGFQRIYTSTNQLDDEDDPLLNFSEGTGYLYVFLDEKKSDKWVDLAARDLIKNQMIKKRDRGQFALGPRSLVEVLRDSKKVQLRGEAPFQQIIKNDTVVGSLVTDNDNKSMRFDFDALFPDTVQQLNLLIMKLRITESKMNAIYRQSDEPDGYVSQANLRAVSFYTRMWTKALGKRLEYNLFRDFYVEKSEFLTKEEYEAAAKADKERKKNNPITMTSEELDRYMEAHNIPELTDEMKATMAISRQLMEEKAAKKEAKKKNK